MLLKILQINGVLRAPAFYQGYFHILGGTISSSNSQRKKICLINSLIERVKKDNIEEVILATSATVEGQTTAFTFKIV